jgi:O-antigen chain-terminating methyltransferase
MFTAGANRSARSSVSDPLQTRKQPELNWIFMLFPNNSDLDPKQLAEKVRHLADQRSRQEPLPSRQPDNAPLVTQEPQSPVQSRPYRDNDENAALLARLQRIPVLGRVAAHIARRLRRMSKPGLTPRQRLRLFPVIGPALGIAASILRLNGMRAELADLRYAQHLQQLALDEAGARLRRLEEAELADRLLRVEDAIRHHHVFFDHLKEIDRDKSMRLHHLEQSDLRKEQRVAALEGVTGALQTGLDRVEASDLFGRIERAEQALRAAQTEQAQQANRIAGLKREWHARLRDAQAATVSSGVTNAAATPASAVPAAAASAQGFDIDSFYLEFEDVFRGSRKDIGERLEVYLPYLRHFAGDPGARVVDVGCGRGEWLELMARQGIEAIGIDLNASMVDACRKLGFRAECSDAIAWLRSQPAGSIAAVTGFHLIEHLPFETLIELFDAALHALRDDGLVIFETPNPENYGVGAFGFYYDPTHRNPIVPAVAEFIARQRGFAHAELLRLHPFPPDHLLPDENEAARYINKTFLGPQDFSVIAWKTHAD